MSSSQDIPTQETSELVEPMEDVNDVQLPETHEEAEEEGTSSPSPELIPSEQENEESTEPPPQQQKDDNEQEEPLSTSVPDEVVETTTTTSPVQKEEEEVMENKNNDDQGRQRHQLRQQQSLPYHCYEDGKAPPPPTRQNIIFDGALSLDGRSLLIPNRPDGAGSDFDDISSINTDHYHYMTPTTVGANYHPHHPQGRVHSEEDVYPEDLPLTFNPDTRKGYGSPTNPHPNELTVQTQRDPEHGSYEEDDEEGGCVPEWIMEAPQWLKVVILLSGIFLLGAIVMVGVGAAMIIKPNGESTPFTSNPNPDNFTNIFPPPSPPVDIPETEAPTIAPVSSGGGGSSGGGEKPTEPINVTSPPIKPSNSSIVTFYVIAGRFIDESLTLLPDQLTSLPTVAKTNTGTIIDDDDIVMFHLGDWNSPTATSCDEESYQTNVDLFSLSSVPVYFVPGDNEYNDCPDPDAAFALWNQYLVGFESTFWPAPTAWTISRQEPDFSENFAYFHPKGILFVGMNLVGGSVHDVREWQNRHEADLSWIDEQYKSTAEQEEDGFELMVILTHADPLLQANDNFFQTFFERVGQDYQDRQVVLVHRNLGDEPWTLDTEYNGISNLMMVTVQGSLWPPMRMQMNLQKGSVDIDQSDWHLS